MKKNYLKLFSSFLVSLFVIVGCQKDMKDQSISSEAELQSASARNGMNENKCRLVNLDWSAGGVGVWQYCYNNKGLADKWTIDYGDGFIISENIYYNTNGQIIKAEEDYFGTNYVYLFYYSGKRLTRLTRTSVDFPDEFTDFRYTYNSRGQNTRQDDDITDQHVLMYYDAMGNCTKTDIYLGTDLWYSDNYTFNAPVKNPWLHVPGIEYGFLAYGGTYATNKRWFTSNRTVIYDTDGTPFVFNDYDPAQTVIQTSSNNLPISATYYDMISETELTITLGYDNCGSDNGNVHKNSATVTPPATSGASRINPMMLLRPNPAKSMKEQLKEIRQQLKNNKK